MDLTNATCKTCPHWFLMSGDGVGYCKRYPPDTVDSDSFVDIDNPSRFPTTRRNYWCGEHPTRRAAAQLRFEAELERLRKEQADGR